MKPGSADLIVFAAIAHHGSLSAAARHLGVQKSSVSRSLALLEQRYGHRLIERSTRHLRLTETGALLLDYANRVTDEIETAEAAMASLSAEPAGALSVTMPLAVAQRVIVPMLPAFLARYPKIRIGIDVSSRLLDLITEGIDVAIRLGPLAPSNLIARRLSTLTTIMVAAPAYLEHEGAPQTVTDLARHRLIGIGTRATPMRWEFDPPAEPVTLTPSLAVDEAGLGREMALAGLGIARLPQALVFDDLEAARLVQVLPEAKLDSTSLYAVHPSRRALAPKVAVFVDAVAEAFARIAGDPTGG